jgi:hypothetical protein
MKKKSKTLLKTNLKKKRRREKATKIKIQCLDARSHSIIESKTADNIIQGKVCYFCMCDVGDASMLFRVSFHYISLGDFSSVWRRELIHFAFVGNYGS